MVAWPAGKKTMLHDGCSTAAATPATLHRYRRRFCTAFSSYFLGNWLIFHLIFVFGVPIMQVKRRRIVELETQRDTNPKEANRPETWNDIFELKCFVFCASPRAS